jgi:hypothetical protein
VSDRFRNARPFLPSNQPLDRSPIRHPSLPSLVAAGPFGLWRPDDPIPASGRRLLLGVATWSVHDMELLDELARVLQAGCQSIIVDVFNVVHCSSPADLERFTPGVGKVFHTPVVGLWVDGELKATAAGKAGRDLLARSVYGWKA